MIDGRLTVKIDTDNAAFDGAEMGAELARILRWLADCIEDVGKPAQRHGYTLHDVNGNEVGRAELRP